MKVITTETEVYKFKELPEEGQQAAINNLYDINVDYEWWENDDGLLELTSEEFKSSKIKLSKKWYEWKDKNGKQGNIPGEYPAYTGLFSWRKIYFDLDRGSYIQFIDLIVNDDNIFRKFLKVPKRLWDNSYYLFNEEPGREVNTWFIIEPEADVYFTEKQQVIIDNAIDIMNDKIREALSSLKSSYEYLTSEEAIIETIEANDYEFTIDGKLF